MTNDLQPSSAPIRIAILGGGIGGMSAAHELVELGKRSGQAFDIRIYEARDALGGKARSQLEHRPGGGTWPGEHGFRFFPAFYSHVIETMQTTPYRRSDGTVSSVGAELNPSNRGGVALEHTLTLIERPATSADSVLDAARQTMANLRLQPRELAAYSLVLLQFLTSSYERRLYEYDTVGWDDFIGAKRGFYSDRTRDLLLAIPGNLSAMKAHEGSSRTIGNTSLQVLFNFNSARNQRIDAVLPAPTDLSWLEPWTEHLAAEGVAIHYGQHWDGFALDVDQGVVTGATLADAAGAAHEIEADYYVLAVPIEVVRKHLRSAGGKQLLDFDQAFANIASPHLDGTVRDMVGAQFFLRRDIRVCKGHIAYPMTPLALTSISQRQFWTEADFASFGIPDLQGVLSVVVSDWDTVIPDGPHQGKTARQLGSREAVLEEVWRELVDALHGTEDVDGNVIDMRGDLLIASHLCSEMQIVAGHFKNETPLLVHPRGSFNLRPLAETRARNLLIAADYVRTYTDLASMESANEAARRAVRVIAHREGIHEHDWPAIYPLSEHWLFAAGRAIDTVLFRAGLPHVMAPALRVIFGEADVGAGVALAQESTGRRSLSSDAYLAVLEALEAGVEVGTATPTSEGFDPLGWLDGVARNLRGALALGEDVLAALAKKLRAWAKVHPDLFSGEGFGTEAASMEAFVRGWEALLREARP
ncbi:MAG: NAD(P)-binding protein [Deltaproteobacteria bacterium]|nr:NAD(P)-binding protein [Deltaproteobacteria bacterium]